MSLLRGLTGLTLLMLLTACGQKTENSADSAKVIAAGNWTRASNLTEAISDIHAEPGTHSGIRFTIAYYNLDATVQTDLYRVLHLTHTSGSTVQSDDAHFTASIDCGTPCKSGTLTLKNTVQNSNLKGSVRVQFAILPLVTFNKQISASPTNDPAIGRITQTLLSHYLLGGTISQFQMSGGFVTPFDLSLQYSTTFLGQNLDEVLSFHGTNLSGGTVQLDLVSQDGQLTSTLPASISLLGHDSLEICFSGNSNLLGIGAYGPSVASAPQDLCRASNR